MLHSKPTSTYSAWLSVPVTLTCLCSGSNSIKHGWLDPTVVGKFDETTSPGDIRRTLTLEETPRDIPGAQYPSPQDLRPKVVEYPITAGDTLAVEINELRQRQVAYQSQA